MHLVLRSSQATKEWSFKKKGNERKIEEILKRFSHKYGVRVLSLANVGNHLHLQIKLSNRFTYKAFIRAITGAIAMAITGRSRWSENKEKKLKFWDYRPFTRVVQGYRALLTLRDYIEINKIEGYGHKKGEARFIFESLKEKEWREEDIPFTG